MSAPDPFELLGLTRAATLHDVRAARRRLAFDLHPDRGGDPLAMQELNAAFDACVAHLTGRRELPDPAGAPEQHSRPPEPPRRASRRQWRRPDGFRRVERDAPSFTVDALPAEAFEALLVVTSWIGEVLDDDPPYVLECHLHDPSPCWCRLDLVPDAGGSTVSLVVASVDGTPVSAEAVRDVWVDRLGRPMP